MLKFENVKILHKFKVKIMRNKKKDLVKFST